MKKRQKPWNKGRKLPAEPLTRDEVKALLTACSNRAPTGIRNRALIVLFYRGGLRVKEALSLMPKDCDTKQGTIRVFHGKGDKARLIGLDPEAAAVLQRWLDRRTGIRVNGRHPVFCTLKRRHLNSAYVRNDEAAGR